MQNVSMSTLSKIVFNFYNLPTRNICRQCTAFYSQKFYPAGRYTDAGLHDPSDYILEDSLEESINDPQSRFLKKVPGKQSVKKQTELLKRQYVKDRIISKKLKKLYENVRPPKLLTWAARAQIKHLNKIDPVYWTPGMLSESFPVSRDEIIKVLQHKRLPMNEHEIYDHDKKVHYNWLKLKEAKQTAIEGGPIDPDFKKVFESTNLELMKNAAGSNALPTPDTKHMLVTQEEIAQKRIPVTRGEFSAILEDYQNEKTSKDEVSSRHIRIEDQNVIDLLEELSKDSDKFTTPKDVRFIGIDNVLKRYTDQKVVDKEKIRESRLVSSDDIRDMGLNKSHRHAKRHKSVYHRQNFDEDEGFNNDANDIRDMGLNKTHRHAKRHKSVYDRQNVDEDGGFSNDANDIREIIRLGRMKKQY